MNANGEPEAMHYCVLDVLGNTTLPGDRGFSGGEHNALLVLVAGVDACRDAVAERGSLGDPRGGRGNGIEMGKGACCKGCGRSGSRGGTVGWASLRSWGLNRNVEIFINISGYSSHNMWFLFYFLSLFTQYGFW